MVAASTIAGYVILAVGGLLIIIAIILTLVIIHKRKKAKHHHARPPSPDQFKVVYNMPMANGASTKVVDAVDARSVHTIPRSEPGYIVASPPQSPVPQIVTIPPSPAPVMVKPPPVVAVNPLPRAVSLDHLNYPSYPTLPRAGYRYVYPSGTTSRILVPISKKKAKRIQKQAAKPVYIPVYPSGSKSLLSAPAYATSARSVRSATSGNGLSGQKNKYYMYGSTPNLHAQHYTQPVLMYDGKKRYFHADEINAGRNEHVQNWLSREGPNGAGVVRANSHASSVPTELDTRSENSHALHLRWSPRMRRKLDSDRDREQRASGSQAMQFGPEDPPSPRYVQPQGLAAEVTAPNSPTRYTPLHNYTELSEAF